MIKLISLFPLIASLAAASADDLPCKSARGKYAGVWNATPFTLRPATVAPEPELEFNPLKDYSLTGVSWPNGGFRVILLHRNNPTERIIIDSTRPWENPEFRVIEIIRDPDNPLATTVTLAFGDVTGTVGFDLEPRILRRPPSEPDARPRPPKHHRMMIPQAGHPKPQAGPPAAAHAPARSPQGAADSDPPLPMDSQ